MPNARKAFFILVIGLCWTTLLRGAIQFSGIGQTQGVGISVSEGGGLYLAAGGAFPADIAQFGYYLMDAAGNAVGGGALNFDAAGGNTLIGEFAAGTRIAFWAAGTDGTIYDSMHRDGRKGDDRHAAYIGNNGSGNGSMSAIIGGGGYGNGYSSFRGEAGSGDFIFTVTGDPGEGSLPGPTGQPLPGVALSLLAGGAMLAGLRRWRRR